MYQLFLRFARKLAMKPGKGGIMEISNNRAVIDTANEIQTLFKKHGVPNEMIKTENDIKVIYNQIKNIEDQAIQHSVISPGSPRHKEITEKLFGKKGEVVDMTGKKIDTSKGIMGGKQIEDESISMTIAEGPQTGKKITMDEFFEMTGAKNKRKIDVVTETVTNMKKMTPIEAMKEANLVIGRKGKYKKLTVEESQEILKKTDDHIFEREIKYDADGEEIIDYDNWEPPEDFAQGGRSGTGLNYLLGEDDQNSRVPYGSGGAGKPPITFGYQSGAPGIKGGFGGPERVIQNQGVFGPVQVGIYGGGSKNPDVKQSTLGIGGQIDLGKGWSAKGSYDKSRTAVDSNYYTGVPVDEDSWRLGINKTWKFADGGRTGFGIGGMSRRAFLKMMGAGAAGVGAAKSGLFGLLKAGKPTAVKTLTQVPIGNAAGMPAWFKPLVNKIIKEGTEIGSHQERVIVHASKLPDSKTPVHVIQELDTGNVAVDIGWGKHGFSDGHLGQPARLEYKASEWIEPTVVKKGQIAEPGMKTSPEFKVEEAEFTGGHPENIKFEETTISEFGEHGSNFDEVEKFATGKIKKSKPTKKRLQTEFESGKAEADAEAAADMADDFASGGRVPLDGGGPIDINALIQLYMAEGMTEEEATAAANKPLPFNILTDKAEGGRVPFIFGGGAIKNVFKRLKDLRKMPRTEKMMKPNPKVQHLFSEADKMRLAELKLEHAEAMLDMLKADRQLFVQFQSNKAMKDEGMDFLMKKMLEPMAPHIKDYKSLKEIDEAILNMEMIVKNKSVKQGSQLHASGGLAHMLGE